VTVPVPTTYVQGVSAVTADNLNTFVQTAENVSQARSFVGIGNMVLSLQGTVYPNDGGQGFFWYNSTSTATDDNGVTTIVPLGVSIGAWIRLNLSSVALNSITNADLAQVPADTLKGNNTGVTANVNDLTVAQVTTLLGGQTSGTLATGNDSRFTYIGQTVISTSSYNLNLANQGTELYFTAAGTTTVTIPALAWTPSALIVLRVATGTTVSLVPGTGMNLLWIPTATTGTRTLTGPALATLSFATSTLANIGAGGIS
jgi:hypothetical protein